MQSADGSPFLYIASNNIYILTRTQYLSGKKCFCIRQEMFSYPARNIFVSGKKYFPIRQEIFLYPTRNVFLSDKKCFCIRREMLLYPTRNRFYSCWNLLFSQLGVADKELCQGGEFFCTAVPGLALKLFRQILYDCKPLRIREQGELTFKAPQLRRRHDKPTLYDRGITTQSAL